ncbi:MAG: hypothetical protein Q9178_002259 [Gyalolechia marmorata]
MNDEVRHRSEEHDLRSWHPAHMPESDAARGPKLRLSSDLATGPPSSQDLSTSTSSPIQEDGQSPRYIPDMESEVGSIEDQAYGGHALNPHLEPYVSNNGDEKQHDEHLSGLSHGLDLSACNDSDDDLAQDNRETRSVNGLSLIGQRTQEASSAGSSNSTSAEPEYNNHITNQKFDQGFNSQRDSQKLPAFGALDRTNSFPAIPPLHQARNHHDPNLAQSQVENILEEAEHTGHAARSESDVGDSEHSTKISQPEEGNLFGGTPSMEDDDFFNYPSGAERGGFPIPPADDEARFEEGLPLVPSASLSVERRFSGSDTLSDNSGEDRQPANEDFFGEDPNLTQDASFFQPKSLDRKTTGQVLHGMTHVPYDATHHTPTSQKEEPLLEKAAADFVNVSRSIASSSAAEPSEAMSDFPAEAANQKEEDLAALWQAALDDDDLLDDVELPADQPIPSAEAQVSTDGQAVPVPTSRAVDDVDRRVEGHGSIAAGPGSNAASSRNRYAPASTQQTAASPLYQNQTLVGHQSQPAAPQTLSHSSSAPTGFSQSALQQLPQSNVPGLSRPSMPAPAQSFADKAKGGYTSPYDLPMDVNRPKRRTNLQQVQTISNSQISSRPLAPPRSSSMYASGPPTDSLSPPLPPLPGTNPPLPSARPSSSNVQPKPSVGSFFEELPVTKSRPPSSASRYASAAPHQQPIQLPLHSEPARQPSLAQRPTSSSSSAASSYQLVPPERQSPYANLPQHHNATSAPVQLNSRYSPAPSSQSNVPPPRNRYAVSPAAAVSRPPISSQAVPFQPRTSSPLAQNSTVLPQTYRVSPPLADVPAQPRIPQGIATTPKYDPIYGSSGLPQVDEHLDPGVGRNVPGTASKGPSTESLSAHESTSLRSNLGCAPTQSSPSNSGYSALTPDSEAVSTSEDLHPQYLRESQRQPQNSPSEGIVGPPRRPQTQSPGITRPRPEALARARDVHQRPASATTGSSYSHAVSSAPSQYAPTPQAESRSTQDLHYIRPNDGREHDPLERWKGGPIFKFGFGGSVVTSFPKQIPRYTAGHGFPMIKCSPGEVKLQIGYRGTLEDEIASFPGPLKSKSKKKELLEWLQKKIDVLARVQASVVPSATLPDPIKRHEEKILLWKVMKVFVEYDGTVARNSKAEEAVRTILCPDLAQSGATEASLAGSGVSLKGISKPDVSLPVAESLDPNAMESVRRLLLQGEREKAVWHAVDRRMWAHAMVLASTLDKSVWKQVLHEFTRLEVKPFGESTESLAALYEVFAGNWEESIDELVPPSARAGLQMVSKASSTGPIRNALDGLDKWRETLTLILSNRTQDDENALIALGRLLAGYSRVEAAHLCLLFAKLTGLFGGMEDAQANVVLLGADHQQQPFDYGRDLDSIFLTEIYEFARSVLASSASLSISPHLQSYKLYHAMLLAESGYRSEAQQYCDAIMNTLKSTTKPSPYFHNLLFTALDDLLERLQQAPRDGSSWMSKPMDKMSGSMWKRLNNFIVGDESDTGSVASGKGDQDAGPFARVAADAPSASRSASSTDLYGAFSSPTGPSIPAPTAFGSRYAPSSQYAPSGQYTPRSSLEQQGRPSEELQRPVQASTLRSAQAQLPNPSNPSRYTSSPAPRQEHPSQQYKPSYRSSTYYPPNSAEGYSLTPPLQPDHLPITPPGDTSSSLQSPEPPRSSTAPEPQHSYDYTPNVGDVSNHAYEPPSPVYDPSASAYEPPSSYAPYDPEGQDNQNATDERSPKKKKSFMDDDEDDDFAARAAAVLKNDKARKDKEANEAFRKAAEADAQKDLKPKKSGWFGGVGGWLGSKKDDDLSSQEPKAIKAKLGEESSFYYDKELKKWVNKKGPAPAASEAPKAPPPRGPPSRAVSGAGGPPVSMSASRTSTPPVPPLPSMLLAPTATPPIGVSQPPTPIPHQSQPPSGNGTPARTASPAMAPAAAAALEQASSSRPPSAPPSRPSTAMEGGGGGGGGIDDLLGEPQVRKGGTMRRGKKGRGYVDVMAK